VKKLFAIILLSVKLQSTAQNLVPNPSFELYNSCPASPFFSSVLQNWYNPPNQAINFQYFNNCTNPSIYGGIPINALGYEMAYSGNAYIAIALGVNTTTESRYYVGSKLSNTLILNKSYKVSLMYSCPGTQYYANRNFGVLFTNSIAQFGSPFPGISAILPYTPQLENVNFLDNRNGWKKLSWIYKANGTENYITLGNFKDNLGADLTIVNPQTPPNERNSGIYIDDVVVEPYNCATELPKDTTVCNTEQVSIQLPTNALASYTWQDGTIGANYNINAAGTYWVTTTALGCTTTDTIKVKYKQATPFSPGADKAICKDEVFTLQVPNIYNSYLWQNNSTAPTLQVKDSGLYFVKATEGKCTYTDTIKLTK
jgi:hypothetical protein